MVNRKAPTSIGRMQPDIYRRARRYLEFKVQDLTIGFLAPYIGAKQLPKL